MPANIFTIPNSVDIETQEEFFDAEKDNVFSSLIYYPNELLSKEKKKILKFENKIFFFSFERSSLG